MRSEIQKAVRIYYALRVIGAIGFGAIMATYIQFLRAKGLGLVEIHILSAVFFTTQLLFEVPTGAFADHYGRKNAFVLSCFLLFASKVLYVVAPSFGWFIVAEFISGCGLAFSTGAMQSWLEDRLKSIQGSRDSELLLRVGSRENMLRSALLSLSVLACSRLSEYSLNLPWIVSAFCLFVATVLSYCLLPPDQHVGSAPASAVSSGQHQSVIGRIQGGARVVWLNEVILLMMAMGVLQNFAQQAPNINWQPYLKNFLSRDRELGYAFTYMLGMQLLGSFLAPRLARIRIDVRLLLSFVQIAFGFGIAGTVLSRTFGGALVFLGIYSVARGLFSPLKEEFLHRHITDSTQRTTLASYEALPRHIGSVAGALAAGMLIERYSMATAWVLMGGLVVVSGIMHAWRACHNS